MSELRVREIIGGATALMASAVLALTFVNVSFRSGVTPVSVSLGSGPLWDAAWRATHRFDAGAWRSARADGVCRGLGRDAMVPDLRKNHLRSGMGIRDVQALLGFPTYWRDGGSGEQVAIYVTDATLMDCRTLNVVYAEGRLVRTSRGQT